MRATAITLVLTMFIVGSTSCPATVLHVDCAGGGAYTTIQAAVDASVDGDTLMIAPCVYEENVDVVETSLTLIGSGAAVTELKGAGTAPAIQFIDSYDRGEYRIFDMSVSRDSSRSSLVSWERGLLRLERCVVGGNVWGWISTKCRVEVYDCELAELWVEGGGRTSEIHDSDVSLALIRSGGWDAHYLNTSGCHYGTLRTGWTSSSASNVTADLLEFDSRSDFIATGSKFGGFSCHGGELVLDECTVSGALDISGTTSSSSSYDFALVTLTRCLVDGDINFDIEEYYYAAQPQLHFNHNTILGDVACSYYGWEGGHVDVELQSNIVVGSTTFFGEFDGPATYNDFVSGASLTTDMEGEALGNISMDPRFCTPLDYRLEECSPCVGAADDGGDMGAFPVGCGCSTNAEAKSWGALKALYR